MMRSLKLLLVGIVLVITNDGYAQSIYLSGSTRDSTTFDLLPYVTIHSPRGELLASSDDNGYFSLRINPGDTIVFTRLGYKPVKVAPGSTAWDMNVMMPETVRMLNDVVIYDKYIIHGHEEIQKNLKETAKQESSAFKNQTAVPTANANLIQTFGPGLVFNGAISKLLGTDREKKKVSANKSEIVRTQVYYEVIRSMQVKEYLMNLLGLTEAEYLKGLEKFKLTYPTAIYIQSREEVVRLMVESFAIAKK